MVRADDALVSGTLGVSADEVKALMKDGRKEEAQRAIQRNQHALLDIAGSLLFSFVEFEKDAKDAEPKEGGRDDGKKKKKEGEIKLTLMGVVKGGS